MGWADRANPHAKPDARTIKLRRIARSFTTMADLDLALLQVAPTQRQRFKAELVPWVRFRDPTP